MEETKLAAARGRATVFLAEHGLKALCIALGLLVTGVYIQLNFRSIQMQMPYPRNFDEPIVTNLAKDILTKGSFSTGYFRKPPFPVYLATIGMALGYLDAAKYQPGMLPAQMGSVGFPHYTVSRVLWPARALFALMGALALLLLGAAAWRAFALPPLFFLVPFIGMLSPYYFYMTSGYINVDVPALFFSALLIAWVVHFRDRESFFYQAIAPGALAGLATACKYNFALSMFAVLLMILLHGRPHRVEKALLALLCAPIAFLLVTPFALLDFATFLRDVGIEVSHYATGHQGFDGEPGLPQLRHYLSLLSKEFSIPALLLALAGLVYSFARNWRTALLVYAFPLGFFAYMCGQRVNFERGILIMHITLPVAMAAGLLAVWQLSTLLLARIPPVARRPPLACAAALLPAALAACFLLPLSHLREYSWERPDSRKLAVEFILKNVDRRIPVVAPEELGIDLSPLIHAGFSVATPSFLSSTWEDILALQQAPLMLLPKWGYDDRFPGKEKSVQLNEWTEKFKHISEFGSTPVLVNYQYPVKNGNPKFYFAQDLKSP